MKIVIVGGVAGGASTAARLRRLDEHAEIILLERGGYISFANCGLPYYIGGVIKDREDLLVQTVEGMRSRFHIDVRVLSEATGIDRSAKKIRILEHSTGRQYDESYDYLVLATGSSPVVPDIKGIEADNIFTLWNMKDTDNIKRYITEKTPKTAAIVGAGFVGLEMVENLRELGMEVSLIELQPQVLPQIDKDIAGLLAQEMIQNGVMLYLGESVREFESMPDGSADVHLSGGNKINADMVILSIGVRPNSELAKDAGLELNNRGGIVVDERLKTSDPHIFAVGDAVQIRSRITGEPVMVPLAGPANKEGRICADVLCGVDREYKGAVSSSVIKVFGLTAAQTGLTQKALKDMGHTEDEDFFVVRTYAASHAGYYPGAEQIACKLYYDKDGKVLGAQAVGKEGVDKRINAIAVALHFGADVTDLAELELCYAPPFSSAKDPVNILGYMAQNQLEGIVDFISYEQALKWIDEDSIFLDVREDDEVSAGCVERSVLASPQNLVHK
jgi:NADPH-dependent 2,4-dienoyl-CoA reductase/sulfur reductase-like enzyme